jgi:hypothetical protein
MKGGMRMEAREGEFIKDSRKRQKFIKKENRGGQREERGNRFSGVNPQTLASSSVPALSVFTSPSV